MKTNIMATYLISVKLLSAQPENYQLLEAGMKDENIIAVPSTSTVEKTFSYYGNQDLWQVNNAVKRAAAATGKIFFYTVLKDKRSEKQQHHH